MSTRDKFPSRPETEDEWQRQLLELMSVDAQPNVFLLGAFAKYVTIYAQQVRALNLIAALATAGRLSPRSHVGVIGGGIAGMTAAAAAATAGVAQVSIFETETSVMRMQRNCEKRYVHPHIYDWPSSTAMDQDAGLPVMNWTASSAAEVVRQLDKAWKEVQEEAKGRLSTPRCGVKQIEFDLLGATRPRVRIDGEALELDVLILAVGFGVEQTPPTFSYWSDDDLGAAEHEKGSKVWLVSGTGDGALTDLMRLAIKDFRHQHVLDAVDAKTRERIGRDLSNANRGSPEEREQAFRQAARQVNDELKSVLQFREVGRLLLNERKGALFEPGSSILNRFICAWLLENERFELVPGDLPAQVLKGDEIELQFAGQLPQRVHQLVVRHGPQRPLDCDAWLAPVKTGTERWRNLWRTADKEDDWTREPRYARVFGQLPASGRNAAALPAAKGRAIFPLRIDFGDEIGSVVVTGRGELKDPPLSYRVGQALERLSEAKGTARYLPGRRLSTKAQHLRIEEVLSSPAHYERAVRALCTSEIAVFDVTDHQSGVMLLLGLRSALRRGVTVTVTQKDQPHAPFNLISLNPVPTQGAFVTALAKALESAFASLAAASDRYLDLPAFDSVRSLGDDYRLRGPEQEILMLGWFDAQYHRQVNEPIVASHLQDAYKQAIIGTVRDSRSPQLVEQRLYAALRRTQLCVADLTGSRPSVLFEIGVRLAVSEHHPLLVLCEAAPDGWLSAGDGTPWPGDDPWLGALEQLFGLTRFVPADPSPLGERIKAYKQDALMASRGGSLSPGRTYSVVSEALDRSGEPGGRPLETVLLGQATLLAGPSSVDDGEVPVLFGALLKEQVRRAATETTLAAWYYYLGRHKLLEQMSTRTLDRSDPRLQVLEDIASALSGRLRNAPAELREFRQEVLTVRKQLHAYRDGK